MKTFEKLSEEYNNINMIKRGGQKIVFSATKKEWGQCVIKLYFAQNDPRSLREIEIEKNIDFPMIPKIFDTGIVEYENHRNLVCSGRKNRRKGIKRGFR